MRDLERWPDEISVSNVHNFAHVTGSAWKPEARVEQPVVVSLSLLTCIQPAGSSDDLVKSVSYADLVQRIEATISEQSFNSLLGLLLHLLDKLFDNELATFADQLRVEICLPKALHQAEGVSVSVETCREQHRSKRSIPWTLQLKGLAVSAILGVFDFERQTEQPLVLDLAAQFELGASRSSINDMVTWPSKLASYATAHLRSYRPKLLETYCETLPAALHRIPDWNLRSVHTSIYKPSALVNGRPCVSSLRFAPRHRPSARLADECPSAQRRSNANGHLSHEVTLGIGSNIGDRMANIEQALALLTANGDTRITGSSLVYESQPMYMLDQAYFHNAVIKIATTLSPQGLLARIKEIEAKLGRRKTIDNGPREIDLDILFYDDVSIDELEPRPLIVPHPRIHEREFVLRPLADIEPDRILGSSGLTVANALRSISVVSPAEAAVRPALQSKRTRIMSVINVTPDSFSDGGDHASPDAAVQAAREHVAQGADILDIGGVSTRPGAAEVSEQEELRRVIPVITAIRSAHPKTLISIDTFRANVAKAAVHAGANWINDVSGGTLDAAMLSTAAQLGVPIVLMHMRGTPSTMSKLTDYGDDVMAGVCTELAANVSRALQAGVLRWNIILDPGIGFAKDLAGNLAILRELPRLHEAQLPDGSRLGSIEILVGVSRKKFLGTLTHRDEPKERVHATAAAM
ncbi:hypothetical protein E5Q_02837 [Mixia osmundae IAM 14324]|uniref:Folic acid synthesis protein FOL1 n=1 Tax=Mixia osmundae (strain CBS 9802 / IAM 14324 / JCM 22182 / KY 12970) TaxID=764103 RepID=G7E013_MIXOS|nr:hypothetical protein E5Q_02837 [Mixia osmundae IAM 14324]